MTSGEKARRLFFLLLLLLRLQRQLLLRVILMLLVFRLTLLLPTGVNGDVEMDMMDLMDFDIDLEVFMCQSLELLHNVDQLSYLFVG